MSKKTAWFLRIALTCLASAAIAWVLFRKIGWHPAPPQFHVAHWPIIGRRLGDKTVELLWPRALWALVAIPAFGLVIGGSLADLPWAQRWLGVGIRSLLAATLVVALARPSTTTTSSRVATVFVVDVSDSVPDEALTDFHRVVEDAVRGRGENAVRLLTFARRPRVVNVPDTLAGDQHLAPFERHDFAPGAVIPAGQQRSGAGAGSDLAAALSLSYGLFPPGYLRRDRRALGRRADRRRCARRDATRATLRRSHLDGSVATRRPARDRGARAAPARPHSRERTVRRANDGVREPPRARVAHVDAGRGRERTRRLARSRSATRATTRSGSVRSCACPAM